MKEKQVYVFVAVSRAITTFVALFSCYNYFSVK